MWPYVIWVYVVVRTLPHVQKRTEDVAIAAEQVLTLQEFTSSGIHRKAYWLYRLLEDYGARKHRPVTQLYLIATDHWWQWLTLHLMSLRY